MDSVELLKLTAATPGEDESWLEAGWLESTCLTLETRAGIIDWLIQVQQYLGLTDTCLHGAVASLDLALSRVDWDPGEIQLLALAALQTSAKMEEDTPPSPALLLPMAGGVYTKADLARVELELLQALNWSVRQTTAAVFLHFYSEIAGKGRKPVFKMAKAILDLCLFKDWYGTEKPSVLASCCLAAACCLSAQPWCEQLTQITGNSWSKLSAGVRKCFIACTQSQNEGFGEKHGKMARNLVRLEDGIRTLLKG